MQKLDKFGRLVIPVSYRKILGLNENSTLCVTIEDDAVVVRRAKPFCRLCYSAINPNKEIPLCEKCMEKVKKLS